MQLRTPSAFLQVCRLTAAWLLAFAVAGCLPRPQQTQPPPLVPAPAPANPRAQPPQPQRPQPQRPPPRPPTVAPSPASVPGRLKIALVSSWLWIDGQYASPLGELDYVGLFGRLLDRREASADGVEARTLELEADATSDVRILQDVLSLVEDADYERVVLVTSSGRFSFCNGSCSASNPKPESAKGRRTAVLLRRDVIALWSGKSVPEDAAGGADPKLEKLLEIPRSGSDDDFEAGVRGVCSKPGRCSHIDLYFEEDLPGREVLRVIQLLERAAGAVGTTPPVISLSSSSPPLPGEEASVFVTSSLSAGRLPPVVIRQIVRASYGAFRECYERGLMMNPKLQGRVNVRFVIQQDGSVDQIANEGADLASEDVIDCVLHGFRALRFPAPRGGIVTVQYPILLVTR
jgi:hypothetical protein